MAGLALFVFFFALTFSACSGQSSVGNVQLDLVFPRNQSTYQPTYPFPVVFAIHNPSILWPIHWTFTWRLESLTPTANGSDLEGVERGEIFWEPVRSMLGNTAPVVGKPDLWMREKNLTDPWLLIYSVKKLVNSTASHFILKFSLTVDNACRPDGSRFTLDEKEFSTSVGAAIFFHLSKNGDLPDVGQPGSCASPIGAISLNNTYFHRSDPCSVQPELSPITDCAYKIDHSTSSTVEENLLAASSCNGTGISWPNTTGLIGPCQKSSGALKDFWRTFLGGICVAMFGLLL